MNKISSTIAQAMHAATFQNRNALPTAVADDRTQESMNMRIERFEDISHWEANAASALSRRAREIGSDLSQSFAVSNWI
jgi:hypothetical protein